jgi:hypothetical protein
VLALWKERQSKRRGEEQSPESANPSGPQRLLALEQEFQQRRLELEKEFLARRHAAHEKAAAWQAAMAELRLKTITEFSHARGEPWARHLEFYRLAVAQAKCHRARANRELHSAIRRLDALRETFDTLIVRFPGLLLQLLDENISTSGCYEAGGWLQAAEISAADLDALGYPTPQLFIDLLRKKAVMDHDLVQLRKGDAQVYSLAIRDGVAGVEADTVRVLALPVNTPVQFEFTTGKAGYVTLINPGTSGRFWLHVPNGFAPAPRVAAGQICRIPGPELLPADALSRAGLDYREKGPSGWEYLAVIISDQPLLDPSIVNRSQPQAPIVLLGHGEIQAIETRLRSLPSEAWTAGVLSFRVVE